MRRRTVYLPTPCLRTVSPGGHDRVVAIDAQPVTLPFPDDAEAPVALTVTDVASGSHRDYRLFDDRLWTALGGGEGGRSTRPPIAS